jgi:hypothetical protein
VIHFADTSAVGLPEYSQLADLQFVLQAIARQ